MSAHEQTAKYLEVLADALATPGEGRCAYARMAGGCPAFCRCASCPLDTLDELVLMLERDRLEER